MEKAKLKKKSTEQTEFVNELIESHNQMEGQGLKKPIPRDASLIIVAIMVSLITAFVWLNEVLDLPHLLLGAQATPVNWRESIIETIAILITGVAMMMMRLRLSYRRRKQMEVVVEGSTSHLAALRQVGLEIASNLDLDELLQLIVSRAVELLDAVSAGFYLYNPERDVLELTVTAGSSNWPVGTIRRRGEGLSGKVLESGQPIDVENYDQWKGKVEANHPPGRSIAVIGVPVRSGEELLGVLNVGREVPDSFSKADEDLLDQFAVQAAIAIQNARLFQSEQEERALAETLRDAASSLSSTLDFDEVLDRILDNIEKVIPCGVANLMLIEDGEIHIIKGRGYSEDQLEILKTNLMVKLVDSPILRRMAETGQPLAISDTRAHSDWMAIPETEWIRSYAGAPITIRGKTIGFLNLDSVTPGDFTLTHAKRLQVFADQAAVAIENSRLYETAQHEIVERVHTEEALRESESRYRAVVEDQVDMIHRFDTNFVHTFVNDAFCRAYGRSREELIGQNLLMLVPAECREVVRKQFLSLTPDNPMAANEEKNILPNGTTRWYYWTDRATFDHQGQVIEYQGVGRDITERKQMEEALQRLNTKLSQYVNRLERRNTEVTLLNQVGDLLQSCQTPEEAYAVIEEYAGKLFPELMGALFVLNETKDLLAAVSAWGGSNLRNETFAPETCWAMRRGRVHAAEAGSRLHCRHVRDEEEEGEFRPYICVPLSTQGELLGMLHLSTAPGQTIGEWKQLAMTVAERAALAISNLRLREKLRMDSILDPLTDLFNRRFLDTMLERELLRAARRQRPVSVAMIDLDNLKQVNDSLGHGAGDVLLQELGRFFEASIRKEDFVCRYGGDEFTITFPEMALEDAYKRLEKLRKGVKKLNIQYRDQTLEAVTVSIGVACYPQDGETVAALLKAADQALYRSKEQGRDRVIATGG